MDEHSMKKYKLARFFYSEGYNYITDKEYDDMTLALKEYLGEDSYYSEFKVIYEDEEPPVQELTEIYLDDTCKRIVQESCRLSDDDKIRILGNSYKQTLTNYFDSDTKLDNAYDVINESELRSIHACTAYEEAFDWFKSLPDCEIIFTPKIDGINLRLCYMNGELTLALTRGRKGDALDVTSNVKKVIQNTISENTNSVIYCEAYCLKQDVSTVSDITNIPLTLPRGAGMSLLRRDSLSDKAYSYLNLSAFKYNYGDTLSESLDTLDQLGFNTVPYLLLDKNPTMNDYDVFCSHINKIIDELYSWAETRGIPTDGVVVEVNSRQIFNQSEYTHQMSEYNRAFKIGKWEPGVYKGTVIGIECEQKEARCNCVALIEPVVTQGGQKVSRVNLFNPAIMIGENINIGSEILFKYKNETTVDLIYKRWYD